LHRCPTVSAKNRSPFFRPYVTSALFRLKFTTTITIIISSMITDTLRSQVLSRNKFSSVRRKENHYTVSKTVFKEN